MKSNLLVVCLVILLLTGCFKLGEVFEDEDLALPGLSLKIGMNRAQLFRKMAAPIKTFPSDFIRSFKLAKAKTLLGTTDLAVSEVTCQVGIKMQPIFPNPTRKNSGSPPERKQEVEDYQRIKHIYEAK